MDRDVLLAVRLEDRSYVEIGQTFGLSVVEVEQLFAQALSELLRNPDRCLIDFRMGIPFPGANGCLRGHRAACEGVVSEPS